MPRTTRLAAALAAASTVTGAVALFAAVLASQGLWYAGYVSEAGVPGQPYVAAYRLGLFGVAAGQLLLAVSLRSLAPVPAALLAVSGVFATVSGSVSCSARCPLPPFETPTGADLVHGGASTTGVLVCGLAILLLALWPADGQLRRVSRRFLWVLVPLGTIVTFGLVALGRGYVIGASERGVLVMIVAWTIAAGVLVATARHADEVCKNRQHVGG